MICLPCTDDMAFLDLKLLWWEQCYHNWFEIMAKSVKMEYNLHLIGINLSYHFSVSFWLFLWKFPVLVMSVYCLCPSSCSCPVLYFCKSGCSHGGPFAGPVWTSFRASRLRLSPPHKTSEPHGPWVLSRSEHGARAPVWTRRLSSWIPVLP